MELRFVSSEGAVEAVFTEAIHQDVAASRLSWKYRGYYRLVRPILPLRLRQLLQRSRGGDKDPDGLFPHRFMAKLAGALEESGALEVVHPWPEGRDFGFALTHDVESMSGLRRCLQVATAEAALGFRSSFNLVPHGYPIDHGITRELVDRGFEVGVHGYNHDGRLFMARRRFRRRARRINEALRAFGSVGFRAPMAHRNLRWMQELELEYDGSCFDADPFQAMPGGVGTVWPFIVGRFVELPYTLPQDHTVFVVLGQEDAGLWTSKLDYLKRCSGLASMLTHPDYLGTRRRMSAYVGFLERVRDAGGYWHALPREVSRWWRRREASSIVDVPGGGREVAGPGASDGAVPGLLTAHQGLPVFRRQAWVSASVRTRADEAGSPEVEPGVEAGS